MSTGAIVALVTGGSLGLAATIYFAYQALAASRGETDAVRDLMAERGVRRDAETARDRELAERTRLAAEVADLKVALATANAANVAAVTQEAQHARDSIDAASGASLVGVVSGELSRPLPGTAPRPATERDGGAVAAAAVPAAGAAVAARPR